MPELILKSPPLQVSDRNPEWKEGSGQPKILRKTYWEVGDRIDLPEDRAKQLVETGVCDYANPPEPEAQIPLPEPPNPGKEIEASVKLSEMAAEMIKAENQAAEKVRINQLPVNDESAALLDALPVKGLGKATAEALLVNRPEGGYESLEHLIGLNTLGQIKPSDLAEHITFN